MDKPFSIADLAERSKASALPAAEAAAKSETEIVFAWLEDSIKLMSPMIAGLAIPMLEQLKATIEKKEDEISPA